MDSHAREVFQGRQSGPALPLALTSTQSPGASKLRGASLPLYKPFPRSRGLIVGCNVKDGTIGANTSKRVRAACSWAELPQLLRRARHHHFCQWFRSRSCQPNPTWEFSPRSDGLSACTFSHQPEDAPGSLLVRRHRLAEFKAGAAGRERGRRG